MKLRVQTYFMLAAGAFLCGCETVGAFGTGRITKEDVAYIAHAGTQGPGAETLDVNSLEAGDAYDWTNPSRKVKKADVWLEKNLW